MRIEHLSRNDAVLTLEIVHESISCSSEEQLLGFMAKLRGLIAYEAGLSCIASTKTGVPGQLRVLNVDYPADYLSELFRRDLAAKDPIVVENFRTFRLQYWADTFGRTPCTEERHEILALAEDFGFMRARKGHGYGYGVNARSEKIASFFCFHGLVRSVRTETILTLLVPHFHEALRRLRGLNPQSNPALTPREKEVLNWLAQGKSTWDISMILRISERTVKFHIGNILRKLNASNRSHAVAIALEYGLVDLD